MSAEKATREIVDAFQDTFGLNQEKAGIAVENIQANWTIDKRGHVQVAMVVGKLGAELSMPLAAIAHACRPAIRNIAKSNKELLQGAGLLKTPTAGRGSTKPILKVIGE